MKLVPALENEKKREDKETWNKVFLHKDGKFYHAYDWSAWLIKNFVCTEEFQKQRGDEKLLSVKRYKTKNHEYVMLGFPIESVSKYIPEHLDINTQDNDIVLTMYIPFAENYTYERIVETIEKWKQELPFAENKQKSVIEITNGDKKLAELGRSGLFQIVSRILSYPLESSTPTDNMVFIGEIKRDIVRLL